MKNTFFMFLLFALLMLFSACGTEHVVNEDKQSSSSNNGSGNGSSSSGGSGGSSYIFQDFEGSGTPTGWTYSGFSRRTSDGIDNTACLGFSTSSYSTASVTTAFVSMGTSPILSFKYKATTQACCYGPTSTAAADGAVQYTIFISTDDGTTWTSLNEYTDIRHISSADYVRVHIDLSSYSNQRVKVRINFARQTDAYVLLDDLALGTVPPIFSGATTLAAGTVYNNYSSPMSINARTYSISNKGASSLTFSELSTTGGITVIGLQKSLDAFDKTTFTIEINASDFSAYSAYNGSFTFNTNDANRPTVIVNATGDVIRAPEGDTQNFAGTGTPTGWSYSGFSRRTSDGVDNTACLGFSTTSYSTASVTTALVAMGPNPVLSFKYKVTTQVCCYGPTSTAAADGAVLYTVSVSANNGAAWENILTDVFHVSSNAFETITANLPATYANQVIRMRITFARVTDAFVLLDDIAMGSELLAL